MQEFKYLRDGATLVISLDGLNWLSKRRCNDKGVRKRDDELQVLISSGQMIPAEEEPQPITCFCILDQRGRGIPQLWRSCDHISSSVTRLPCLSFPPRQRRLLEEPTHHSTLTASAHSVSECTKEAPWTRLILNMQDMFSFLKKDLNIVTQQDAVTEKQHNRLIIFCDGDIPQQLFSDTLRTEDCWTSPGDTAGQVTDNASHWSLLPDNNNNNSEGIQHELVSRDDFNTCKPKSLLKSCQIHAAPGGLSERDGAVKRRKSVSFDDDVMVYLFDQESPTVELHSGSCTPPPSSHSCNLPDVTLEDGGLEWEDDFSALEKSCHFQWIKHSVPQHCTLSLPTRSCSALSRRRFLSQTCLFLTHVTESDLEL
ncbi:serine/threonine-protein kinase LMTK2-like isoform X3 [Acanthopagrus latus]|uniref:serine/threonine-protein kinase LMTK2-like isoform X3 n=1 Tax=Acanthopagrus latus TaxID=8177 RepID=UPI00187C068F|nr:serine/threonine-protein kinase LMTK2-like isoform X3 [Acanthopagrus latus]